ncbi:TadE/TadG family type IV pilus assembly protein [Terrabacter sp. NPDC080008]|uniref:TadE/TadG family type IV pilus assembly protein n=1 Tax=Terrabacter sp. NPDC080008 TaxID=3155176 RepID=UPI00344E90E9
MTRRGWATAALRPESLLRQVATRATTTPHPTASPGGELAGEDRTLGREAPRVGGVERGSAIAEFVMVAALLLVVAMGVFQLGLALYVRNTLISAASEGARYGARADADPGDGTARTRALVTSALSASFARDVTAVRSVTPSGVRVVEVHVSAPLPLIGVIGPSGRLTVSGRAFSEEQVVAGGGG